MVAIPRTYTLRDKGLDQCHIFFTGSIATSNTFNIASATRRSALRVVASPEHYLSQATYHRVQVGRSVRRRHLSYSAAYECSPPHRLCRGLPRRVPRWAYTSCVFFRSHLPPSSCQLSLGTHSDLVPYPALRLFTSAGWAARPTS